MGLSGTQLKYGPIMGCDHPGYPVGLDATQYFPALSGHFVTINTGNGYAAVSTSAAATIFGWADVGTLKYDNTSPFTSSATAGNDIASIIIGSDVVFRLPVQGGTFAATSVGYRYDLATGTINGVANAQGVAVGTTSHQVVIVVGGDLVANAFVDVIMNPATRGI